MDSPCKRKTFCRVWLCVQLFQPLSEPTVGVFSSEMESLWFQLRPGDKITHEKKSSVQKQTKKKRNCS